MSERDLPNVDEGMEPQAAGPRGPVAGALAESLKLPGAQAAPKQPADEVPFGSQGAQFLCNLLQHSVFLGFVVLLLMIIRYFGER